MGTMEIKRIKRCEFRKTIMKEEVVNSNGKISRVKESLIEKKSEKLESNLRRIRCDKINIRIFYKDE